MEVAQLCTTLFIFNLIYLLNLFLCIKSQKMAKL
nr:MAG TPA: hypothetical protein [Caudoviricetes sp.]